MKCDRCRQTTGYLKVLYGIAICRICLIQLLEKYGEYYGHGKFWIPKEAILK